MRRVPRTMVVIAAVGLSWMAAPLSHAGTITDLNISSYATNIWGSNQVNGTAIAAASTSGNTGSGLTFGNWTGKYFEVGAEGSSSPQIVTFGTAVTLNNDAVVNTLINSFYGVSGTVNATITFTNSNGATAQFSLVGNQTIRDYNQNIFTDTLSGLNIDPSYGLVTAQNWWNNSPSGQRLDAQTFVLPSAWGGTSLVSMTIANPYTASSTADVILSAAQVDNRTPAVPEPPSIALLLVGLGGIATAASRRPRRLLAP